MITPERLAQIRRYCAPSCDGYLSMPDKWLRELLAHVDDLTRQLDDARRLALPAFTSPEGDLSEHMHVLDCAHEDKTTIGNWDGPLDTFCNACGAQLPNPEPEPATDRPSAYDMPVGSVVETERDKFLRLSGGYGWDQQTTPYRTGIQSGWIEGLFSDGLVAEWRLP